MWMISPVRNPASSETQEQNWIRHVYRITRTVKYLRQIEDGIEAMIFSTTYSHRAEKYNVTTKLDWSKHTFRRYLSRW